MLVGKQQEAGPAVVDSPFQHRGCRFNCAFDPYSDSWVHLHLLHHISAYTQGTVSSGCPLTLLPSAATHHIPLTHAPRHVCREEQQLLLHQRKRKTIEYSVFSRQF